MPQEFVSEYGLEPGDYVEELITEFCDRCPELTERPVTRAIFVDDGPVDYLVWFVLDDHEAHTFFYHDSNPDQEFLQQLLFLSPTADEMAKFEVLLRSRYETYRELDIARLLELPDTYQPQLGVRPRANLGFCHEPAEDRIVSGVSGTPRRKEQQILKDIDRIVPDRSLEKFMSRTVQSANQRIKAEADRHTIDRDVRGLLDDDSDFRQETVKPLPKGIHPTYAGEDAELWQKPASKVEYIDGSQGFVQVWLPIGEDRVALVAATAGEYDRETVVDAIREEFKTAAV
jgi:hypothetical protein